MPYTRGTLVAIFFALSLLMATAQVAIGPISLTGKYPTVDADGVQAAPGTNLRPAVPGFTSPGKWIWREDAGHKAVVTRFRKVIRLHSMPSMATLLATAEVSYRLWINGALVSRGPADTGRDYDAAAQGPWLEDVRDVKRFLRRDDNVIAVEVFPDALVSSEGSSGRPGLKIDLHVAGGGEIQDIATDESWRSKIAEDLEAHDGPNGFRVDASLEPVGWQKLGFDDSRWEPCSDVSAGRKPTLFSELAPPMEAVIAPTRIVRASDGVTLHGSSGAATFTRDGSYAIRYPRVMSARVAVTVQGHKGGRLLIMMNERDAPGYNRRAEILLRDGAQSIELPFFDGFSTINLEAHGVREPITVQQVRAIFVSYPVRYSGSFECDNDELNRLWKVSRWVTQICMQTHHLDSPDHQEPICDPGDYLIEALNSYYAFGESSLARQDLRKFARILEQRRYQNFHTSYALLWLQMLIQYFDYTGDNSLLLELAPTVHGLLDRFETYVGKNGLISNAPNYMFMDWVDIAGFNAHHPPAVIGQGYMTALYYRALANDARVAALEANAKRVEADVHERARVKSAFDRELWSDGEGLYRDGRPHQSEVPPNDWLPADKDVETFSTQVNVLAVSTGISSSARSAEIMGRILARPDMNCQPYFMHFVFDAMAKSGTFLRHAVSQMHRWKILPDTQSFYEMWNQGDRSHAWNATLLFQMSGRVLGVTPLDPGFRAFEILPQPLGLRFAKGTVPTPHGPIRVEWQSFDGHIDVSFTVPKGTQALCGGRVFSAGRHKAACTND